MNGDTIVIVVEDDAEVRTVLLELLQREGFVARGVASGEELLESSDLDRAGCIVVDMRLPAMQGVEVIRRAKMRNSALPVVMITAYGDVPSAVEAMKAGAIDYLLKPIEPIKLVNAIRAALKSSEQRESQGAQAQAVKLRLAALSEDERSVYRLLVAGHPNKQIAAMLQIGLRTVELRRANLLKKMEAGSLPELVRLAILGGLTEEPPT